MHELKLQNTLGSIPRYNTKAALKDGTDSMLITIQIHCFFGFFFVTGLDPAVEEETLEPVIRKDSLKVSRS